MNLFDKIQKLLKQDNTKKFMTNLLIFLIIGVILMIVASTFTDNQVTQGDTTGTNTQNQLSTDLKISELNNNYSSELENKLEKILSSIKGIGEVKVMVTLEETAERIPAINTNETKETTKEKDSNGGTRETIREDESKQVVTSNNGGDDSLIVLKEVKPKVKGVIVVAEGVEDPTLKEKVYRAVKTVLGIPGNKVDVFSSN